MPASALHLLPFTCSSIYSIPVQPLSYIACMRAHGTALWDIGADHACLAHLLLLAVALHGTSQQTCLTTRTAKDQVPLAWQCTSGGAAMKHLASALLCVGRQFECTAWAHTVVHALQTDKACTACMHLHASALHPTDPLHAHPAYMLWHVAAGCGIASLHACAAALHWNSSGPKGQRIASTSHKKSNRRNLDTTQYALERGYIDIMSPTPSTNLDK